MFALCIDFYHTQSGGRCHFNVSRSIADRPSGTAPIWIFFCQSLIKLTIFFVCFISESSNRCVLDSPRTLESVCFTAGELFCKNSLLALFVLWIHLKSILNDSIMTHSKLWIRWVEWLARALSYLNWNSGLWRQNQNRFALTRATMIIFYRAKLHASVLLKLRSMQSWSGAATLSTAGLLLSG